MSEVAPTEEKDVTLLEYRTDDELETVSVLRVPELIVTTLARLRILLRNEDTIFLVFPPPDRAVFASSLLALLVPLRGRTIDLSRKLGPALTLASDRRRCSLTETGIMTVDIPTLLK